MFHELFTYIHKIKSFESTQWVLETKYFEILINTFNLLLQGFIRYLH